MPRGVAFLVGLPLVSLVLLAAGGVASASDARPHARFTATISGTYTSHGTEVDSSCYRRVGDPFDPEVVPITVTTTGDESLTFKSRRPVTLDAYLDGGKTLDAGTLGRRSPVDVTTTVSQVASEPCTPDAEPAECGTKHFKLGVSMISREPPPRLLYDISDGPGRVIFPDNPFPRCVVPATTWWGKLSSPGARVPVKKLFNRRVKRIPVSGHLAKSTHSQGDQHRADGHYDLRYTITLVRKR
jgi:hypothetical protein